MAKKDFSSIGASTGSTRAERVYSSLEQATNQQRHTRRAESTWHSPPTT